MQAVRRKGINVIGEIEFGLAPRGQVPDRGDHRLERQNDDDRTDYHLLHTRRVECPQRRQRGQHFARMVLKTSTRKRTDNGQRIFVLEMSSFQLDDIQQFRPKVAMLLNITPDHLDRYEYQLDNYVRPNSGDHESKTRRYFYLQRLRPGGGGRLGGADSTNHGQPAEPDRHPQRLRQKRAVADRAAWFRHDQTAICAARTICSTRLVPSGRHCYSE